MPQQAHRIMHHKTENIIKPPIIKPAMTGYLGVALANAALGVAIYLLAVRRGHAIIPT